MSQLVVFRYYDLADGALFLVNVTINARLFEVRGLDGDVIWSVHLCAACRCRHQQGWRFGTFGYFVDRANLRRPSTLGNSLCVTLL